LRAEKEKGKIYGLEEELLQKEKLLQKERKK
jgi:hypothetical protein